jgi:hypothetical protein
MILLSCFGIGEKSCDGWQNCIGLLSNKALVAFVSPTSVAV